MGKPGEPGTIGESPRSNAGHWEASVGSVTLTGRFARQDNHPGSRGIGSEHQLAAELRLGDLQGLRGSSGLAAHTSQGSTSRV